MNLLYRSHIRQTKFAFLFTAVSGVFNTILSEIPDDEISILHGAMSTAAAVSLRRDALRKRHFQTP